MDKRIAAERTRMYKAIRELHPLYFGDPMTFYAHGAAYTGDPFGGPMMREYNGSGGGLIGAVIGVVAAVATGGASLGFTTLASTLSTIGLVSSVVGAVTGNKIFSTIGAVAGLGSAFMSLSSAGTFGDGLQSWATDTNASIMGSATQTAAPVTDAIVNNVSDAGAVGLNTVSETQAFGTGINSLTDANLQNASGLIDTPSMTSVNTLANNAVAGTNPSVLGVDAIADTAAPGASAITGTSAATPLNIANLGEPQNAMSAAAQQGGNMSAVKTAAQTGVNTGESLFDKISKFANDNKAITEMALKGIGSAYTSPEDKALKDSQTAQANAASGLYDARTAEIQGQMANANAIPNVQGQFSVNKNAQIFNPRPVTAAGVRPAGLIQTRSM